MEIRSLLCVLDQEFSRHSAVFRPRAYRLIKLPPGTLDLLHRNSVLQLHNLPKTVQMTQTLHARLFKITSPQSHSFDRRLPPPRCGNDRRSTKTDVRFGIFRSGVDEKWAFRIQVIVVATSARAVVTKRKQIPLVGCIALLAAHQQIAPRICQPVVPGILSPLIRSLSHGAFRSEVLHRSV